MGGQVGTAEQPHIVGRRLRIDRLVAPFAVKIWLIPDFDGIDHPNVRAGAIAGGKRRDEIGVVLIVVRGPVFGQVLARPVWLKIDPGDDFATARKRYRKLARQFHPDRRIGDPGAERKFREVQNAWDAIRDRLPKDIKMWPQQMPFQPTVHDLHTNGRAFPPNHLHERWLDSLYWDIELEE